jgi:O-antigen/teichoic acid export membrane protein
LVVAARYLPEEALGAFILLQFVTLFLSKLSSLGLELGTTRLISGAENEPDKRRIISTAISCRLIMILSLSFVLLLFDSKLSDALSIVFSSEVWREISVFIPLLFLVESSLGILQAVLQGRFRFGQIAIASFLASMLNLLLTFMFVVFFNQGVAALIYARLLSVTAACALMAPYLPISVGLAVDRKLLKRLILFGIPLQINELLTLIFQRIDTLLVGTLLGPTPVAYYAVARRLPDGLGQLYDAFRSVYFSYMSRFLVTGEQHRAISLLSHSTRLVAFLGSFAALVAVVFGVEIISLLFSKKYLEAVPIFTTLMIGFVVSRVSNVLGTSLVAAGDSKRPAVINVVHSIVSLLGNFILIPQFGAVGAALASLIGSIITNPLNFASLRSHLDIKLELYLKPILIFLGFLLISFFLESNVLLLKLLLLLSFSLTCYYFSVILKNDIIVLKEGIVSVMHKPFKSIYARANRP